MPAVADLPPVVISPEDHDRLSELASLVIEKMPDVAHFLLEELKRAQVVVSDHLPTNVVTMGSTVTYLEKETGRQRRVRLVYPKDANLDEGRMSVLTPVGAALLGLQEGASFSWRTRSGVVRDLVLLRVTPAQIHNQN